MKLLLVTSVLCLLLTPSHASTTSVTTIKNDVTSFTSPTPTSMPPGWEGMCHVTNLTLGSRVILCHVTSASRWDIDTFRNWSRTLGAGHMIDLEVTCSSGGAIVLPWPYRAQNLRSLTVRSCTLLDWLEESSRPLFLKSMEDTLQHLRLENNVAMIRLQTLYEVKRNMNEEFDCGPRNLKSYVQSGTDYQFDPSESLTEEETMILMEGYLHSNSTENIICQYNNLEVYEDTHRSFNSIFSVYLLTKNSKMPRLSQVNLSHGQHVHVPRSFSVWHQEFPALQTLDLSHNLIQNFNLDVFGYMRNGLLDLTYNNVTTLGKQELTSLRAMGTVLLNISHNPFHCACATAYFSDFLHDHAGPEEARLDRRYAYLWRLTCQSPPGRRGRRVSEFSKDDLCREGHGDKRVFLLFLLLPLAAGLVGLYLRFKLEVDVFLFAHLGWLGRCGRGKSPGPERQLEYDVYVSHSQSERDVQFVLRELRPRLEAREDCPRGERRQGRGCYKLCLECRDFQVGAHVAENILTKMAGSRAVVMLLSADMPADSWAEFEFQEALFRAVSERRRLLVFLQRGSLEPRRLSPALRRALRLFPLLQVGERQFWKKLDYFLQRNAACPASSAPRSSSSSSSSSSCCCCWAPCCSSLDPEKELEEVKQLARANAEKSRRVADQKEAPALSPPPPPPLDSSSFTMQVA